ncbi:MAG: choice-of-anchor D domain-containing protein [Gemmatimonadota bacterium]|nr:choice-of-anchor D domain-containing protein [Gemmatimonadota bacterium]
MKPLLLIAVLLAMVTQPARAYVYRYTNQGRIQKWATMPVSFAINNRGTDDISSFSELEDALKSSFDAWDQVTLAGIQFYYTGPTSSAQVGNDGQNVLAFDSHTIKMDGTSYIIAVDAGPSVVGIAMSIYNVSTGEIVDCDIVFNDAGYKFTTTGTTDMGTNTINLRDVACHEIGHLVGLDHTFLEHGTMWPYAKDGQRTLSDDDIAGVRNLYPGSGLAEQTERFSGTVTDESGNSLWGIYVSAIREDTELESIAAITGDDGTYLIDGVVPGTAYYLKARSVDLEHVGAYFRQGDYGPYIPQYYSGATLMDEAEPVTAGAVTGGLDFTLSAATIVADYDKDAQDHKYTVFSSPMRPPTTSHYFACHLPASVLPESFIVFSMTFYNNDGNMLWPRIMLATGSETSPDMDNILRTAENYVGKELDYSTVEWESYQGSNARDLWVVFQFPDRAFVNVGDGPGMIADSTGDYHGGFFYSIDGGNTFLSYPNKSFDLVLYLTVGTLDAPLLEPQIEMAVGALDFGLAKVGTATSLPLPVSNLGTASLEVSSIYSSRPDIFSPSATTMSVPASGNDTLRMNFTPKGSFQYTGVLTIVSNDPAYGSLDVSLSGAGARPALELQASTIDFGEVQQGESVSMGVWLGDTGLVSLLVSGVTVTGDGFSTQSTGGEVAAGDSLRLDVVFSPTGEGSFAGTLGFTTDDPDKAQVSVDLTGTGLPGQVAVGCDFNKDGSINIVDVIALLLFQRANPGDPGGDFNADGNANITDAIAMLLAQRDGACPDAAALLASADGKAVDGKGKYLLVEKLENLSPPDIIYLEGIMASLGLSREEEDAFRLALYGQAGGATLPKAFALEQNFPNPFNPATVIGYSVPESLASERVSLKVYNIRGSLVRVLADGYTVPGSHTVYWDGTDERGSRVPSGVYLYRLRAGSGGGVLTRKMVVLN